MINKDLESFPKIWMQSKHDENFNEISYIDNKGLSYEYINPAKRTLKYYRDNNIDINQEMLDNIKDLKSDDPKEQLFLNLFNNLILEMGFGEGYEKGLKFVNSSGCYIFILDITELTFYLQNHKNKNIPKLRYIFEGESDFDIDLTFDLFNEFFKTMLAKHLNIKNIDTIFHNYSF